MLLRLSTTNFPPTTLQSPPCLRVQVVCVCVCVCGCVCAHVCMCVYLTYSLAGAYRNVFWFVIAEYWSQMYALLDCLS